MDIEAVESGKALWQFNLDGYKYVLYSTNKVLVYKGDKKEPSYEITEVGCTCPADRYRMEKCKHRKVVVWLGDGSSGEPQDVEPEVIGLLNEQEGSFDLNDLMS